MTVQDPPTQPEPLTADSPPRRRDIGPDQVHPYEVRVPPDHYLEVVAQQQGGDVELVLYGPDGGDITWADAPTGGAGPESVRTVAEEGGTYRVEARYADTAGPYEIRVAALRPAGDDDRRLAAAHAAAAEARRRCRAVLDADGGNGDDDLEAALAALDAAHRQLRDAGDGRAAGIALYYLGLAQRDTGRTRQAAATFARALDLVPADEPALDGVRLFLGNERGYLLSQLNDPAAAVEALEKAVEAARLGEHPDLLAGAHQLLGDAHLAAGHNRKALEAYQQALGAARNAGLAKSEADTLLRLTRTYAELSELAEAEAAALRALELARGLGDRGRVSRILVDLGDLQRRLHRPDAARASLTEALEIHRELGDRAAELTSLATLGQLELGQDRPDAAEARFQEALELARGLGQVREEGSLLLKLGRHRHRAGRLEESLDFNRRAAERFTAAGDVPRLASARYAEARALAGLGRHFEAKGVLEELQRLAEDLRHETALPDLTAAWGSGRSHYWELYVDVLVHLHEAGGVGDYDLLALAAAEHWKARNLVELLRREGADLRRGADPALLAREAELERRWNELEERLADEADGERRRELERTRFELRSELRHLRAGIDEASPDFERIARRPAPNAVGNPAAVTAVQSDLLAAGDLALVYSLGDERSFLWAVSRDAIRLRILPPRKDLEALAREAANRLRNPAPADAPILESALSRLSTQVLKPVDDLLEARDPTGTRPRFPRLVVVADGALQLVPFTALPLPGGTAGAQTSAGGEAGGHAGGGERLIDRHEVVSLPSLTSLGALRRLHQGRKPAAGTLAVVADPVLHLDDPRLGDGPHPAPAAPAAAPVVTRGGEALPRLPGTQREAAALDHLVADPGERLLAHGFDAHRELVLSGGLAGYRIVHFATHGDVNTEVPELSGLVLSAYDAEGDPRFSFLPMHEIYGLDLPAELVVLSACQTGVGRDYRGEGLVGLARGFMYAGTPRLVVSLWKVDDEATAFLMYLFYENLLRRNLAPAAALREAQRSFLEHDRWHHPYYWAGFVFVGDWITWKSLRDPDHPIEQADTGASTEPPPPRTPEDLPVPSDPGELQALLGGGR